MDNEMPPDLVDPSTYDVDLSMLAEHVELAAAVLKAIHDRQKFALVLGASVDKDAPPFAALLRGLSNVLDQVVLVTTAAKQLTNTEIPPSPN